MTKFYGIIGFVITKERDDEPGSWDKDVVEKAYSGDVVKDTRRIQTSSNSTNDEIRVNKVISIIANEFAFEQFQYIRYVEWMSCKWKVTDIEPAFPRLILTLGGVYNEDQ